VAEVVILFHFLQCFAGSSTTFFVSTPRINTRHGLTFYQQQFGHNALPSHHPISSPLIHHVAIKTRNITQAISFYSLLGFRETCRFRTGPARAVWLEYMGVPSDYEENVFQSSSSGCRLEIIEVPSYMLPQQYPNPRAPDLFQNPNILGYNHFAWNVTQQVTNFHYGSLLSWLQALNETSVTEFQKSLRVALFPRQQIIGNDVYELAFLYDADGCLIELLNWQSSRVKNTKYVDGWNPWDGQGFVGPMNSSLR
jgi:catechol 2,3-dioxygenase-like lactoylglutathione lyase family enzyme